MEALLLLARIVLFACYIIGCYKNGNQKHFNARDRKINANATALCNKS